MCDYTTDGEKLNRKDRGCPSGGCSLRKQAGLTKKEECAETCRKCGRKLCNTGSQPSGVSLVQQRAWGGS